MEEEKKGLDNGAIGMWMILGGFAGIILLIVLVYLAGNITNDILSLIASSLLVFSLLSILVGILMIMEENSSNKATVKEQYIENINAFQEEYE